MALSGAWVKVRKPMSKYPETPQQTKVRIGGEMIKLVCKGKKGKDFFECRSLVVSCAFDDAKCEGGLLERKKSVTEELQGIESTGEFTKEAV